MSGGATWGMILALAVGTYLIRLSFIGLIGDRRLPGWATRHLAYAPVALMPGLVAPLVLLPPEGADVPELARYVAAAVVLGLGARGANVLLTVCAGAATYAAARALGL